jgi:hypothetical protein
VSLLAFQRAQQVSAERQRTVIESVKIAVEDDQQQSSFVDVLLSLRLFTEMNQINRRHASPNVSPEQRQAQLLQQQLSPHELAYQESLIQERQAEIREIETGIHELSEIFHDLGTLVTTQGDMIGTI